MAVPLRESPSGSWCGPALQARGILLSWARRARRGVPLLVSDFRSRAMRSTRSLAMGTDTPTSPAPPSFWAQVVGAFASPVRAFENAAHFPRFFAPFLAALTLFGGFWGVVYLRWGMSGIAVAFAQGYRRGTVVMPDEIDYWLQFSRGLTRIILVGGAASILLHLLVIAWVGTRLTDLFLGIRMRLRATLSVACYAYLAKTIVQTILGVPNVLFADLDGLNFENLFPTNLAFFLDPQNTSRTLYTFLQSLDVVQLWYFTLVGIGFSADSEDRSAPAFMATALTILWVGWSVLFAAFRDALLRQ